MRVQSKFLLVSAVLTSVLPSSLSANLSRVTAEDLEREVRNARSCPVQVEGPSEKKGWFTSFRQTVGNGLRSVGDFLRTEGDQRTNAGHLKEMAKDAAAKVTSKKVGLPITAKIFNPIGNALRRVGQWIIGGKEVQTETRVVLNTLGLKTGASALEVKRSLELAATASYRTGGAQGSQAFSQVVEGLEKRGHSTGKLDTDGIYVEAVAREVVSQRPEISLEDFQAALLLGAMDKVESLGSVKNATAKVEAMSKELRKAYEKARVKDSFERALTIAPASAA